MSEDLIARSKQLFLFDDTVPIFTTRKAPSTSQLARPNVTIYRFDFDHDARFNRALHAGASTFGSRNEPPHRLPQKCGVDASAFSRRRTCAWLTHISQRGTNFRTGRPSPRAAGFSPVPETKLALRRTRALPRAKRRKLAARSRPQENLGPRRASASARERSLAKSALSAGPRNAAISTALPRDTRASRWVPNSSCSSCSSRTKAGLKRHSARSPLALTLASRSSKKCDFHDLIGAGGTITRTKRKIEKRDVDPHETGDRPSAQKNKHQGRKKAGAGKDPHKHVKIAPVQRTMRLQPCRKKPQIFAIRAQNLTGHWISLTMDLVPLLSSVRGFYMARMRKGNIARKTNRGQNSCQRRLRQPQPQ